MSRIQLVFQGGPMGHQMEYRSNSLMEPHINGRLVRDGETYTIRGSKWLLKRVDSGDEETPRFRCRFIA